MDIQNLTNFFMWCTLINGSLLIFWAVVTLWMPNLIYRIQSQWFPISRTTFDVVLFAFLGFFKIFFIVFNLTPYLALLILG